MIIDVNYDKNEETAQLTYFCNEFKSDNDYNIALAILNTFCGDFALEPEIETDELKDIVEKANETENKSFTFFINEEELEAEIN